METCCVKHGSSCLRAMCLHEVGANRSIASAELTINASDCLCQDETSNSRAPFSWRKEAPGSELTHWRCPFRSISAPFLLSSSAASFIGGVGFPSMIMESRSRTA
eukprot:30632-Pelagococcus_subviridis.AAC.2